MSGRKPLPGANPSHNVMRDARKTQNRPTMTKAAARMVSPAGARNRMTQDAGLPRSSR